MGYGQRTLYMRQSLTCNAKLPRVFDIEGYLNRANREAPSSTSPPVSATCTVHVMRCPPYMLYGP